VSEIDVEGEVRLHIAALLLEVSSDMPLGAPDIVGDRDGTVKTIARTLGAFTESISRNDKIRRRRSAAG
jgi:hypothetical protein